MCLSVFEVLDVSICLLDVSICLRGTRCVYLSSRCVYLSSGRRFVPKRGPTNVARTISIMIPMPRLCFGTLGEPQFELPGRRFDFSRTHVFLSPKNTGSEWLHRATWGRQNGPMRDRSAVLASSLAVPYHDTYASALFQDFGEPQCSS